MGLKAVSTFGMSLSRLGAQPKLQLVGQRCGMNGQQGTISGYGGHYNTSHQRMFFPNGADAIQLVFPNFYQTGGNGELSLPPSMYTAVDVSYSGGTGYAAGDIDTFAISSSTGIAAVKVMITAVSSGVPLSVEVIDGGLYNTQLSPGASPASTSGSGTGATATFKWKAGGAGLHIGIEKVWNTLSSNGPNAIESASRGLVPLANTSKNLNLLIPLEDFLITDLIEVDIPVGSYVGLRLSYGYGTTELGRIPISSGFAPNAPTANYEAAFYGSTFTDYSTSGSIGTSRTSAMIQPIAVMGIPKQQGVTIVGIGDSRCYGVSSGLNVVAGLDPMDNDGNLGWLEKALSSFTGKCVWPFSNISTQGDVLQKFVYTNYTMGKGRLRAIGLIQPTAVYFGLNYNDMASQTLATIKSWEQQAINELRGMGVKYVFTDTTDPSTTSTDSWATTTNQTQTASSANQIARNASLRAGTWATYDFFIDQAVNTESSIGSGLWAVNGTANYYTGDGVHTSPQGIALKAATAAAVMAANITL